MRGYGRVMIFAAIGFGLSNCGGSVSGVPQPSAPSVAAPASPISLAIPTDAALGSGPGGPIGALLSPSDRESALNAQNAALESGQRRSWRGAHGAFGFIEPGANAGAGCREYTHTIYVSGRPNRAHGVACRQPDGSWTVGG